MIGDVVNLAAGSSQTAASWAENCGLRATKLSP
jgi:hypothetical protein